MRSRVRREEREKLLVPLEVKGLLLAGT